MSGTRIMIVDDEQRLRKLVRDYMIREGYSVLEAANGREALDLFDNEGNIALIILDVMMPEMDGWQVCSEIRKISKVPIIMLTARSDEKDELRGFELGVDARSCAGLWAQPRRNSWKRAGSSWTRPPISSRSTGNP